MNSTEEIKPSTPAETQFDSPDYKRSRVSYVIQCMLEYFIALLSADAYLAKILAHLGFSDATIGIISSFIAMMFVIQLASIPLLRRGRSVKRIVIVLDTCSQLLFIGVYLIPFLPIGTTTAKITVMAVILGAYACLYLISNLVFRWANSYVDPHKRASFSATKEIISLLSGVVFTIATGYIFDYFENKGQIENAFLFCAILMGVICAGNFVCLCLIKKDMPVERDPSEKKSLRDVLSHTLGNKAFRNTVILAILWESGRYFTTGFLGVYKTQDLAISMVVVQIINIAGSLFRMLISKPFGRYSDKHSFARGIELALCMAALAFLVNVFTSPATWFLIIPHSILYHGCLAGLNANSINLTYSYVDADYITEAMAIKNSIAGLCGFGASLIGGLILKKIQANGNVFLGIGLHAQQLLSVISFAMMLVSLLFTRFVICRQKVTIQ